MDIEKLAQEIERMKEERDSAKTFADYKRADFADMKFNKLQKEFFDELYKSQAPEWSVNQKWQTADWRYDKDIAEYMLSHLRKYVSDTMQRNEFGVPMYSAKCRFCTTHKEEFYDCDLCGIRFVCERTHEAVDYDPSYRFGKGDWTDEVPHLCEHTRKVLNLILYALSF